MEKYIVTKCTKAANGAYYLIELSDGKTGTGFNDLTDKMGMEVELDVKENKPYKDKMQYYINLPKDQKTGGKQFPAKDYSFEKRKASLEFAFRYCELPLKAAKEINQEGVEKIAEFWFEYLNKK
jgi:hypothetical protein